MGNAYTSEWIMNKDFPPFDTGKKEEKTGDLELKLMLLLCALMIIVAVLGFYLEYHPIGGPTGIHLPARSGS